MGFITTDNVDNNLTWWSHNEYSKTSLAKPGNRGDSNGDKFKLPAIQKAKPPKNSPWILNHKMMHQNRDNAIESISYRQGFNRREAKQPMRGKLAGSFVWTDRNRS